MTTQCHYYRFKPGNLSLRIWELGKKESGIIVKEWKSGKVEYSSGIDSKGCCRLVWFDCDLVDIYLLPIITKVPRMTEKREIIKSQSLPPCPSPCAPVLPILLSFLSKLLVVGRASIPHGREAQTHQVIECLIRAYQITPYSTTVEPRPHLRFRKGAQVGGASWVHPCKVGGWVHRAAIAHFQLTNSTLSLIIIASPTTPNPILGSHRPTLPQRNSADAGIH